MSKLTGKRVLITGAAHGIGRRMADQFAAAGCTLVLTDIDENGLAQAAAEIGDGIPLHTYTVDVSDEAAVKRLAEQVLAELGGLDILINNAGIGHNGELVETPVQKWKQLMDVNFWGPVYHVYAFLPAMIEAGAGQIVTVSSGQAFFRLPTWGAYAIIKLALGAFSELLRVEVKKFGIQVTTVYPFMIDTGFYNGIEGETVGAKLSMRLLPYYSQSPATVARIIFKAVKKKKAVEMVSLLNNVGLAIRSLPPIANLVSKTVLLSLGKDKQTLAREHGVN